MAFVCVLVSSTIPRDNFDDDALWADGVITGWLVTFIRPHKAEVTSFTNLVARAPYGRVVEWIALDRKRNQHHSLL